MSTASMGIDAKGYLTGWINGLVGMTSADINAIPDDKWSATFGGCTRSASDVTADAVGLLVWTTEALRGNKDAQFDESVKSDCATKEGAIARLQSSASAFSEALNACSDAALSETITPPWQMEAPLFMIAQIAVSHIWYHDGQLNYIQCLLGDEKIHWMG